LLVATFPFDGLMDAFRPAGHRPGFPAVAGILIGFGGVVLLIGSVCQQRRHETLAGSLVVASLAWTMGSLYGRNAGCPRPLTRHGMEMLAEAWLIAASDRPRGMERPRYCDGFRRSALALVYLTVIGRRFRRLRLAVARRPHPVATCASIRWCGLAGYFLHRSR
jgi:hypothetical protein